MDLLRLLIMPRGQRSERYKHKWSSLQSCSFSRVIRRISLKEYRGRWRKTMKLAGSPSWAVLCLSLFLQQRWNMDTNMAVLWAWAPSPTALQRLHSLPSSVARTWNTGYPALTVSSLGASNHVTQLPHWWTLFRGLKWLQFFLLFVYFCFFCFHIWLPIWSHYSLSYPSLPHLSPVSCSHPTDICRHLLCLSPGIIRRVIHIALVYHVFINQRRQPLHHFHCSSLNSCQVFPCPACTIRTANPR